ncbi:putative holin-like toxin [Filifactor alocis]
MTTFETLSIMVMYTMLVISIISLLNKNR